MKQNIILIFLSFGLFSCKPHNPPTDSSTTVADSVFTTAIVHRYGAYYASLLCNVFSLDLYTQQLFSLEDDRIAGTGTHLHFSDIFLDTVANSLLDGRYRVDTTGQVFTALSAQQFEGNLTGTTIQIYQDSLLTTTYLCATGTFTLEQKADTCQIDFNLKTTNKQTFNATYTGVLRYE